MSSIAYLAGFTDGEGCITVNRTKYVLRDGTVSHYIGPLLKITNTNRVPLDAFAKEWRGTIYRNRNGWKDYHKDVFTWEIRGRDLVQPLREMLPHLLIKRKQAELLIILQKLHAVRKIGGDTTLLAYRKPEWKIWFEEMLVNKMRELNRRGPA